MPELKQTKGFMYLQQTKFDRESLLQMQRPAVSPGAQFKSYPDKQRYNLPEPAFAGCSLKQVLGRRRSRRRFVNKDLGLEHVAALLWAAQGQSGSLGGLQLRTAPSAGGLYPLETYLILQNMTDAPAGIYHLQQQDFVLELLQEGQFASQAAQACLGQSFIAQAQINFFWSAVLRRNMSKYGHRGLRYIFLDAGHVCQNLLLAAEDLHLGSCPVGAFFDQELNVLFGLDGEEESIIYAASLGGRPE